MKGNMDVDEMINEVDEVSGILTNAIKACFDAKRKYGDNMSLEEEIYLNKLEEEWLISNDLFNLLNTKLQSIFLGK